MLVGLQYQIYYLMNRENIELIKCSSSPSLYLCVCCTELRHLSVVLLSFGVLCVLQAILNITLRLALSEPTTKGRQADSSTKHFIVFQLIILASHPLTLLLLCRANQQKDKVSDLLLHKQEHLAKKETLNTIRGPDTRPFAPTIQPCSCLRVGLGGCKGQGCKVGTEWQGEV